MKNKQGDLKHYRKQKLKYKLLHTKIL